MLIHSGLYVMLPLQLLYLVINFEAYFKWKKDDRQDDYDCMGCPIAKDKRMPSIDYSKVDLEGIRKKADKIMEKYK